MWSELLGHYNYYFALAILFVGLVGIVYSGSLIKKLISLSIFQSSIILFYVSMSFVRGGRAPILKDMNAGYVYNAPLPHVLMLTAIVVGIATMSVGLAIIFRVHKQSAAINNNGVRTTTLTSI